MAVVMLEVQDSVAVQAIKLIRAYWALLIPAVLVLRFLYYKYSSPLRHYPGPFLASGSRAWKVLSTYRGKTEQDHIKLHQKFGPFVRIAPNEVSLSSPHAARDVLAAGKGFHKTDFYGVFPPKANPDIFTETREAVHAVKKRYASNAYSMSSMQGLATYIDDTQRILLAKLDEFCNTADQKVDLGDWLHYFAFDVLGEMAFGAKFGFMEAGYDLDGAIKDIDDIQWYDGIVGQIPEWDAVLRNNPINKYLPGKDPSQFIITRMALAAIEKRKNHGENMVDRKDLLSHLMTANEKAPENFGPGDVFAVAHGAVFAGSDSTASTMQSFTHHVLREPQVHKKLVDEILEADSKGGLSPNPSWAEAQALPYFQACLKEAMRVRPAVGLNITRHVPPGGADIGGQRFAGGTRVALNGWVLHRDQGIFGKDADFFRPERWLEGGEAKAKEMERYMFQFGGGSHLCIGKNLALLEMNKTLPLLFREYEFELLKPDEDLIHHSTFFVVQKGLDVKISKREKRQ
ncbi:hypothetical protein B0A48_02104 [Cryoendolithus antarcticus]|uniref:Cytochrome P450 monooxygenase n=1 Tax=Cryoendolithus antarcticus TaxID=1507870 RepID=A0A1V8TN57_9PEZI|nr:hypothetical protein B0A48_02104 [Cryoendolithus antarcticus]